MWKHLLVICCGLASLSTGTAKAQTTPEQKAIRIVSSDHNQPDLIQEIKDDQQKDELICLALGMYHEAKGESVKGQMAVGFVILNRLKINNRTICQTLWERHGLEFPWVRGSASSLHPKEIPVWKDIQLLAVQLLRDQPSDITRGATSFYDHQHCRCRLSGIITMVLGGHTFVKNGSYSPAPS